VRARRIFVPHPSALPGRPKATLVATRAELTLAGCMRALDHQPPPSDKNEFGAIPVFLNSSRAFLCRCLHIATMSSSRFPPVSRQLTPPTGGPATEPRARSSAVSGQPSCARQPRYEKAHHVSARTKNKVTLTVAGRLHVSLGLSPPPPHPCR